jgi:hypothetical protein
MSWVKHLHPTAYKRDILLLPGDVCDDIPTFQKTLSLLSSKFAAIYYTPGNHEAWLKTADKSTPGITDSITKLQYILDYCHNQLPNVHTAPNLIGNSLWIVPLMSWHHQSFDREPDIPGIPAPSALTVADYAACIFPFQNDSDKNGKGDKVGEPGSVYIAEWFDALNNNNNNNSVKDIWEEIESTRHHTDILSMSHFLPYQDLLPEKRYLTYPNLPKAVGSIPLCNRIQSLVKPDIHVFGHTHFAYDLTLHRHHDADGSTTTTRFIQAPLCAPLERRRRLRTVKFREQEVDVDIAIDDDDKEEEEDPVMAAKWLPLMIYQTMLPVGEVDKPPRYRMNLVGRKGVVLSKERDSLTDDIGGEGGDASSSLLSPPSKKKAGEYTWPFDGPPITLKCGQSVRQLHADWSAYYAKEVRNAQIMELAPWVKTIWERRLARHARQSSSEGEREEEEE